jgi:hypothetical protein
MSKGGAPERGWIPFWVMQATEIAVALVFVDISAHIHDGGLLVASALAFLVLAVSANGPLGIVRICAQPVHVTVTIAVAIAAALAPIIPGIRPDIEGVIVLEFGAAGIIRVATLTQITGIPRTGPSSRRFGSKVIDTTATVADPTASANRNGPKTGDDSPTGTGPSRNGPATDAAARWVGRTAGAAARHWPEAEEQVRRTIRARLPPGWPPARTRPTDPPASTASLGTATLPRIERGTRCPSRMMCWIQPIDSGGAR